MNIFPADRCAEEKSGEKTAPAESGTFANPSALVLLSGQKDNIRVFGYVHHDTASRKTKVCLGWGTPNAGVHQGKEGHRENATGGLSVVRVFPSSSSTISIANSTRYGKYFLHSYPTAQR